METDMTYPTIRRDSLKERRRRKRLARIRFLAFVLIGYVLGRVGQLTLDQGFSLLMGVVVGTMLGILMTVLVINDEH